MDLFGHFTLHLALGLELGGLDLGFGNFLDLLGLFLRLLLLLHQGLLRVKVPSSLFLRASPLCRCLDQRLGLLLICLVFGFRFLGRLVLFVGFLLDRGFSQLGDVLQLLERLVCGGICCLLAR